MPLATIKVSPGWATFGVVLPPGAARGPLKVGDLDTQCDVKCRWPDGSVKLVILTAKVPAAGAAGGDGGGGRVKVAS